jgi:phosphatidylglycerol:prolipoprotein diacylglycerol transferase
MIDSHIYYENWGVRPILFSINEVGISSYSFFIFLAIILGLLMYLYDSRHDDSNEESIIFIAMGALIGGAVGAKVLKWIIDIDFFLGHWRDPAIWLSGRTIVGGIIGGMIGVAIVKKKFKIKGKKGNYFAPAIALGIAVGRIGCFLRGCCFGESSSLPWAVDFGGHVSRHPTQLYEAIFMLGIFFYLQAIKNRPNIKPGQLYRLLMTYYFTFRFFLEFIKYEPNHFAFLTIFQVLSVLVLIYLWRHEILLFFKKNYVSRKKRDAN